MNKIEINNTAEYVCPDCDSPNTNILLVKEVFEYGTPGNQVEISTYIPVHQCADCHAEFASEKASILRHEAVCRYLKLLSPSEIKLARHKAAITQERLAELSGVGKASITRWENGQNLQTRANDNLLRLLFKDDNAIYISRHINGESNTPIIDNNRRFRANALKDDDLAHAFEAGSLFKLRKSA